MEELTESQQIVLSTYYQNNYSDFITAKKLNLSRSAVVNRLYSIARKGYPLRPEHKSPHVPDGFSVKNSTLHVKDGKLVEHWPRISSDTASLDLDFFKLRVPPAQISIPPLVTNENFLLEWLIMDHHHGMYSWAEETGANYDSEIARTLMINAAKRLFSHTGRVSQVIILGGGDTMHVDSRSNVTEKSKNMLDVDGRVQKTSWIVYETWCTVIDMALANADYVKVYIIPGNHDHNTSFSFSRTLYAHYRNDKRVYIDTDPGKHRFYRWGSNYFMASHGDTGAKNLASYMMNHIIRNNIHGIERMYVRQGHLHKRSRRTPPGLEENDGVIIENYPTVAASDSWSAGEAYSSIRATVANLWHKDYGQRGRIELCLKELIDEQEDNN